MEMLECASWIGMAQSLFAGILIGTKNKLINSDRILSGWLFLMSIVFLSTSLYFRIYDNSLLSASFLLFNPVIFIYVRSLTNRKFALRFIHLLHLLPFILFEILAFTKHLPFSPVTILEPGPGYIYRVAFITANLASWITYIPLSIITVHRHRIALKNEVSNIESNETVTISYSYYENFLRSLLSGHICHRCYRDLFTIFLSRNPDYKLYNTACPGLYYQLLRTTAEGTHKTLQSQNGHTCQIL